MNSADRVALFRYETIAPLIDQSLTPAERRREVGLCARQPVVWPEGDERPVSRASLYRWMTLHARGGLDALRPVPRKDQGEPREDRSRWIRHAVHLLLERPDRSLNLLLQLLALEFDDLALSRSTLSRELHAHPLWPMIQRDRKKVRRRRKRFEPGRLHDLSYLDGKGSFKVRYRSGIEESVTVLVVIEAVSRAVLAAEVSATEHLGVAVSVMRKAAAGHGLPDRCYADRHSVYDSDAFRKGLAELGLHRIRSKPGDAPPRGRIEAFMRWLVGWFVKELAHQVVKDRDHLQDLLLAAINLLYMPHRHRGLGMSPQERLGSRRAPRQVSTEELRRAFWVEKGRKAHPTTGELDVKGRLVLVPAGYEGKRVRIRYDPAETWRVVLVAPGGREIPLSPVTPQPEENKTKEETRGTGQLQRILDKWRGRDLPLALPGYGLPEVFDAFSRILGRDVPQTESEARAVQAFYREHGPFAPDAFSAALLRIQESLGEGRPLKTFLDALTRLLPDDDGDFDPEEIPCE